LAALLIWGVFNVVTEAFLDAFPSAFFRALGVIVVLPIGDKLSGIVQKVMLAAGLALLTAGSIGETHSSGIFGALGEFLIGFVISLPLALAVSAAKMWGELFDAGRGQTIGSMYDPVNGSSLSSMAFLSKHYVWVLLLITGTLDRTILSYYESFSIIGAGGFTISNLTIFSQAIMIMLGYTLVGLISFYLVFASLFLLVDCFVGLISKSVPQVSFFSESFQVKTYLGFALILYVHQFDVVSSFYTLTDGSLEILRQQ